MIEREPHRRPMRPLLLALLLLAAPAAGGAASTLLLERDGRVSTVPCSDYTEISFLEGEFSPRCVLAWSGQLVRWELVGSLPRSHLDADLGREPCLDAARDAQEPGTLVAKFLFDGLTLRVTTDFATARECLFDPLVSGLGRARLPVEDPATGARMLVVVRAS